MIFSLQCAHSLFLALTIWFGLLRWWGATDWDIPTVSWMHDDNECPLSREYMGASCRWMWWISSCSMQFMFLYNIKVVDLPDVWNKSASGLWDQAMYLRCRNRAFETAKWTPNKFARLLVDSCWFRFGKLQSEAKGVWAYRRQQWLWLVMEKLRVPFPLFLPKPVFIIVDQYEELLRLPGRTKDNHRDMTIEAWRHFDVDYRGNNVNVATFGWQGPNCCKSKWGNYKVCTNLFRKYPDQAAAWADAICHNHCRNNYARIIFVVTRLSLSWFWMFWCLWKSTAGSS